MSFENLLSNRYGGKGGFLRLAVDPFENPEGVVSSGSSKELQNLYGPNTENSREYRRNEEEKTSSEESSAATDKPKNEIDPLEEIDNFFPEEEIEKENDDHESRPEYTEEQKEVIGTVYLASKNAEEPANEAVVRSFVNILDKADVNYWDSVDKYLDKGNYCVAMERLKENLSERVERGEVDPNSVLQKLIDEEKSYGFGLDFIYSRRGRSSFRGL